MSLPSLRVAVVGAAAWFLLAPVADAAVIAYWRFEDSPGFLSDSSGNGRTLTNTGSVSQYALPGTGAGSDFPTIIPQTGASNADAAQFNASNLLSAADSDAFTSTTLTVEAFLNGTNLGGAATRAIAGHFRGDINQRSWLLQVTGTGNLSFQFSTNGSAGGGLSEAVVSSLVLANNVDYYAAVSVDLLDTSTDGITFYLQDLTNGGSLLSEGVVHTATVLHNSTASFTIGSTDQPSAQFAGIIDEVRVSNTKLDQSDLLISVPEPSTVVLAGMGALLLGFMARRRAGAGCSPA
jgi:hypothetical protein